MGGGLGRGGGGVVGWRDDGVCVEGVAVLPTHSPTLALCTARLRPAPPLLLQERLYDQSDAYRVHTCSTCGLVAVANLKKNQFYCTACKSTTGIVQV